MSIRTLIKKIPCFYNIAVFVRSIVKPNRSDYLREIEKFDLGSLQCVLQSLEGSHEEPLFVKVGANNGITGDPCDDFFLKRQSWRGLLIEPVEYCAEKLRGIYNEKLRFTIEQCAIGSQSGRRRFYYLAEEAKESIPGLPEWYDQLGSFDRSHIIKHFDYDVERFIVQTTVEVNTLSALLKRFGFAKTTFLHIDTEGFDLEVLKSLDFEEARPDSILIEHMHLSDPDLYSMITILTKAGYLIWNTGGDFLSLSIQANNTARSCFETVIS